MGNSASQKINGIGLAKVGKVERGVREVIEGVIQGH